MKNIARFLLVVFALVLSGPVFSEMTAFASQKTEKNMLEALKGLKLRQHTGVIMSVDSDQQRLVIKNRRGEHFFSITPDTQVKKGREKFTQADLKPGVKVIVRYWEKEGKKIAQIVKLPKN
jgi:hypothetical protein